MKCYVRTLLLVMAVALTMCCSVAHPSVTYAAETETVETVTQEETEAETSEESNNDNIIYVVFIGFVLFGSLVSLGFWLMFKS